MGRPRIKTIETALEPEKVKDTQPEKNEVEAAMAADSPTAEVSLSKTRAKTKKQKMKVRGKKYQEVVQLFDKTKLYPLEEAISLLKKAALTKFDPTFEAHFNLGIDPAKTEQKVRGLASLPHSTGKKIKLLVFGLEKSFQAAGVEVGDDSTINDMGKGLTGQGKTDFDKIIATPEWMVKLAKVAKVLGPKGLMPNPKSGTVTDKPEEAVKQLQGGSLEFKSENQAVVHTYFGKGSSDEKSLMENFQVLYKAVIAAKPSSVKKNYLKSVYLTATMSPAVKLDLTAISST